MAEEVVTLASIANGAALELFEKEFGSVMTNIADPNTSAKAKRQITITVTIQPDEVRGIGFASLEVKSKLASVKPVSSTMYFGKHQDTGKLVAVQQQFTQPSIFDDPNEKSNIQPLTAVAGGKRD